MADPLRAKTRSELGVLLAAVFCCATAEVGAEDLVIPLDLPQFNFFGAGIGAYPDYFGSSDYNAGAAPFGRLSLGGSRFVSLLGNDVRLNLLDNDHWQLGPMGVWRFGREDVENPVVDRVHHIDDSLSLGAFGGYVWRDTKDIRRMAGVSAWGLGDVSGAYNGWTVGLNAYAIQPVAKMLTLGGGVASTYGSGNYMDEYFGVTVADSAASGLPVYAPGSGVRDLRGWAAAVLHLGIHWHLTAGAMYMRLMGEAADSPLVSQEGSKNQWVYGVGALYAW